MEECPFSLPKERLMPLLLLLCLMTMAQSDPSSDRRTGCQTTMTPDHRIHMVVPKPNFTGPYQRDTVLTCHFFFEQMVPPESISVNWWRNESGSQRIIYAFEHGRRQRPKEDPAYSYRTDLYYNLTLGDASLKIQDLCLKDTGLYVCEAWSEGYSSHGVGSVNLSVAAKRSTVNLISKEDKDLSFLSIGWFPKPLIYWTNENNQNVSDSADTDISLGTDGLYSIKTILHLDTDLNTHKLYLRYINPDTGEKQTDVFLQKPTVPGSGPSLPGIFIGGIISGVFWVLIILCALGALKCQRQTSSNSTSRASYELLEGSEWEQPSSGIHLRLNRRDSTSSYNVEPPLM